MSEFEFEEEEFTTQFTGKTLRRILLFTKQHYSYLIGFLFAIAVVALLDAYFTYLSKQIIDDGIMTADKIKLIQILQKYAIVIVIQAISVFGFIYFAGILGERIQYDLRQKLFNHLQSLSLSFYDKTPVGWIMSRVTSDTNRVSSLVTWGLLDVTWGLLSIVSSVVFMMFISWKLALGVLTIVPILIFIAAYFKKKILTEYRKVRKLNSKITGSYNESINGVRVTKAMRRETENLNEFSVLTKEMFHAGFRAASLSALFFPVVQLVTAFAVGGIVWYSGIQSQVGGITLGGLQAFISYVTFMLWPVQDLARVYAELQQAVASAERVFSLIDSVPEVRDQEDIVETSQVKGDIEFKNVDFYYSPENPVLSNFNLYVERGKTVALVGPTGSGKSTIVNLVSRFYEPRSGSIHIGGMDYKRFPLHSIYSSLGVVLQTPHLFSGTILENISYGRLDATEEEIEKIAETAGAHDFIQALEKGYQTEVGEGGVLLSVGQKQLISLARAILSDPEIIIMDEATSSVDTITERKIQEGLENLLKNRTSFIIAHRLSTIKRADVILVVKDGKIIEKGNHIELLAMKGKYYHLYKQQFRQQLEKEYGLFPELEMG